jgi:glycosyltransferase involved in cell wall biosynthesis
MRLVMDITTSARWKSHDVGITRVERKFAQYLLGLPGSGDAESIFVRQSQPGVFTQLSREEAKNELQQAGESGVTVQAKEFSPGRIDRVLRAGKRAGVSVFNNTQDMLPTGAQADFRAVAVHTERMAKQLLHSLRHRESSLETSYVTQPEESSVTGWPGIGSNDLYVSLGLDWGDKSILVLRQLKRLHGFKSVHMVYDLIPTQFPHWLPSAPDIYDSYFTDLMWTADRLLCISETTQQAVHRFSKQNSLPCPDSEVVMLGADFNSVEPRSVESLLGEEFILFVSTIEPRKNHRFLLEMWTRLGALGVVPKLVFVGRAGWNCDEVIASIRWLPELQDQVIQLADIDDEQLNWLYLNCLFTVYPSLYEGWGLPVVESLLNGKLCIASTAGAVVEAGHGLAIHVDTFDGPLWARTIQELLSNRDKIALAETRISHALPKLKQEMAWSSFGARMTSAINRVADQPLRQQAGEQ